MILYHTSSVKVPEPDILHSRNALDFGKGFYLTSIKEQAVRYGEKFTVKGKDAWLNVYELAGDLSVWRIKTFDRYNEEWLDFVAACRKGIQQDDDYDMIIGGIADDKVFTTINLYFLDFMGKDEALRRLSFESPNNQYCIRSAEMLRQCITYKESIKL